SDGGDGGGADEAVGGTTDRGGAGQAHDAEDGDAGAADVAHEWLQFGPQVALAEAVGAAQDIGERIEDDKVNLVLLDDVADPPGIQGDVRAVARGRLNEEDAVGIGAVGDEAGTENADRVVFETE